MRFIIVADDKRQRRALSDLVYRLGFDVKDALSAAELMNDDSLSADVWLVDVDDYNEQLQTKLNDGKRLIIGFEPAPHASQSELYERWQRCALRNLGKILNLTVQKPCYPQKNSKPWRYVVFLGASMGGVEAVKLFLDTLSPNLPIAVLLAHHYDETMLEGLPKIITRQNEWRCKIVKTSQSLQAGVCLIAPVLQKIVCDSTGRVIVLKQPWREGYRPNIGELLKNTSEVFGSQMIGIILSGMGDDGSQHAKDLPVHGSRLWAQDPATCQSPSQPEAFIGTNVCQFVGSPSELAQKINELLKYA